MGILIDLYREGDLVEQNITPYMASIIVGTTKTAVNKAVTSKEEINGYILKNTNDELRNYAEIVRIGLESAHKKEVIELIKELAEKINNLENLEYYRINQGIYEKS